MAPNGWFKENLANVQGFEHATAGKAYMFGESRPYERYRDLGINIRVLEPGQPASPYHSEGVEDRAAGVVGVLGDRGERAGHR